MSNRTVCVILSGGQDSTTCLFYAIHIYGLSNVCAVSFDYGQRHVTELDAAKSICALAGVTRHEIIKVPVFGGSPLLSRDADADVAAQGSDGLPATFVEGRNLVFLTIALNYAASISDTSDELILVTGVCETDYSGYPDCRDSTMRALELAMASGAGREVFIETPLMRFSKADTVRLAVRLGEPCITAVRKYSVTCYNGLRPGCGRCPSCVLRAKGFAVAGVDDAIS